MSAMRVVRKIRNNLFTFRVVRALGGPAYLSYLARFVLHIPAIVRIGDFRTLDRSMGPVARSFRYAGRRFGFDCGFCDDRLREESFAFGIARELYLRDCYFKWQPDWVYRDARNVVDLGANRGAFSALMTGPAEKIVLVECGPEYDPVIRHNMAINGFGNFAIEPVFIGDGGMTESDAPHMTVDALFDKHGLDRVDLIKIDIEGSEFSLFEKTGWLDRVRAVAMEVHPNCGNPETIMEVLAASGFTVRAADDDLAVATDRRNANFVYAWKTPDG